MITISIRVGPLDVDTLKGTELVSWDITRIRSGDDAYALKACKNLKSTEQLITAWSPALLRRDLDRWIWKDQPHVSIHRLWEYFASYNYLPRLRDADVLLKTIEEGLRSSDYFAFARSISNDGHYEGIEINTPGVQVHLDKQCVLVKPEIALQQLQRAQVKTSIVNNQPSTMAATDLTHRKSFRGPAERPSESPAPVRRFHGSVAIDATRLGTDRLYR